MNETEQAVVRWLRRLRKWWRRQTRAPFYTDLRVIAVEHRHLYRDRFAAAYTPGTVIGLLGIAWRREHFRIQRLERGEHKETEV